MCKDYTEYIEFLQILLLLNSCFCKRIQCKDLKNLFHYSFARYYKLAQKKIYPKKGSKIKNKKKNGKEFK